MDLGRVYILHYTFEIEHPQYGKDTTHRYYYNCSYEEGLEFATQDLTSSGWKILDHDCRHVNAYDLQMMKH